MAGLLFLLAFLGLADAPATTSGDWDTFEDKVSKPPHWD